MMRVVFLVLALIAAVSAFAPVRVVSSQTSLNLFNFGKKAASPAPAKKAVAPAPAKKAVAPAPAKKAAPPAPVKKAVAPAKPVAKAAPTKVVAPVKKVAVAAKPASKKSAFDFTWGGRPNPTPETFVEEKPSFLSAPWRYNKK